MMKDPGSRRDFFWLFFGTFIINNVITDLMDRAIDHYR